MISKSQQPEGGRNPHFFRNVQAAVEDPNRTTKVVYVANGGKGLKTDISKTFDAKPAGTKKLQLASEKKASNKLFKKEYCQLLASLKERDLQVPQDLRDKIEGASFLFLQSEKFNFTDAEALRPHLAALVALEMLLEKQPNRPTQDAPMRASTKPAAERPVALTSDTAGKNSLVRKPKSAQQTESAPEKRPPPVSFTSSANTGLGNRLIISQEPAPSRFGPSPVQVAKEPVPKPEPFVSAAVLRMNGGDYPGFNPSPKVTASRFGPSPAKEPEPRSQPFVSDGLWERMSGGYGTERSESTSRFAGVAQEKKLDHQPLTRRFESAQARYLDDHVPSSAKSVSTAPLNASAGVVRSDAEHARHVFANLGSYDNDRIRIALERYITQGGWKLLLNASSSLYESLYEKYVDKEGIGGEMRDGKWVVLTREVEKSRLKPNEELLPLLASYFAQSADPHASALAAELGKELRSWRVI